MAAHQFEEATLEAPFCTSCGGYIWGLVRQGFTCERCGQCVHSRCMKAAAQKPCEVFGSHTVTRNTRVSNAKENVGQDIESQTDQLGVAINDFCSDDIRIKTGDNLKVSKLRNGELFCTTTTGTSGWIPEIFVVPAKFSFPPIPNDPPPPIPKEFLACFTPPSYPAPAIGDSTTESALQDIPPPSVSTVNPEMKAKAILELIETEKIYMEDLELIVEKKKLIPEDQIPILFGSIDTIKGVNKALLESLLAGQSVGSCFSSMAVYLKVYSAYCAAQDQQLETYERLLKNSKSFKKFISETAKNPKCRKLDLPTFLSKVIAFSLLYFNSLANAKDMQEIIKHSSSLDPDYAALKIAEEKIGAVVHEVNGWFISVRIFVYVEEWRRKEQNSQKMFQIQNILVTQDGRGIQLVKPTRRMLREGQVQESPGNSNISDHNWGSGQVHLLFLRPSSHTRTFLMCFYTTFTLKVLQLLLLATNIIEERSQNKNHLLLTTNLSDGQQEHVRVSVGSEAEKKGWIEGITQAREDQSAAGTRPKAEYKNWS